MRDLISKQIVDVQMQLNQLQGAVNSDRITSMHKFDELIKNIEKIEGIGDNMVAGFGDINK